MGLFDYVVIPERIKCAVCHKPIREMQTKKFDNTMTQYYIGSTLAINGVDAIIADTKICDFCFSKATDEEIHSNKLYYVVVDSVLVGIEETIDDARKLHSIYAKNIGIWTRLVKRNDKIIKQHSEAIRDLVTLLSMNKQYSNQFTNLFLKALVESHGFSLDEVAQDHNKLLEIIREITNVHTLCVPRVREDY